MNIIYRGELFWFVSDPLIDGDKSYCHIIDGGLVVGHEGKILDAGDFSEIRSIYPDANITDYSGSLIMPGFIDTHVHYVQSEIIGMYGKQLLDWLNNYTFPAESMFFYPEYASKVAENFLKELLRNGTTACMAYSSVHKVSADALFSEAVKLGIPVFTGKTWMDREAPDYLMDTTDSAVRDTIELIEKWHGKSRCRYVVTPRFAITSTPDALKLAGEIHNTYTETYMQTHLSENLNEVEVVKSLFPDAPDYLSVYERFGLLTDRSVFGHCIHLTEREYKALRESDAVVSHCPTSNFFLGSGLFSMKKANDNGLKTTMATDVGGGTSFSIFRTMDASYKMQQLQGYSLNPFESYYKSTLGSAKALHIDTETGSFGKGRYADFIVVDYCSTVPQKLRCERLLSKGEWTLQHKLFGLQTLADDRAVRATYVSGKKLHDRDNDIGRE